MRHVAVRRLTLVLGTAFLLFAAAFAWFVRDEAPVSTTAPRQTIADGAALFQRHCATCHAVEQFGAQLREGGTAARIDIETFLRDHGDASDEEDRLILDYLSGREIR